MAMGPILIVGMCPSHKPTLGNKQNATFRKLESWMDRLNITHFSFINTFDYHDKPKMSNVNFKSLQRACIEYNNILALGLFVSRALDRIDVKHYTLPHPSPLNRLLNDKQYENFIIQGCKDYLL